VIAASILLLVGLSDASTSQGDLAAQAAPRPVPAATAVPQLPRKEKRRVRAVRRSQRNDITETLRAMNLMQIGIDPAPIQRNSPNN
jgi:hypothetical protein